MAVQNQLTVSLNSPNPFETGVTQYIQHILDDNPLKQTLSQSVMAVTLVSGSGLRVKIADVAK